MFDVVCAGIIVADVIVKPVNKIPEKGKVELVNSIELFSGGNAMTAALNLKKMGLNSAVIGKVGDDIFGKYLLDIMDGAGVSHTGVKVGSDCQTSASIALLSSDGERSFLHNTGANGKFSVKDADFGIVENSKIVFVTGSFLMDTFDGAETMEFLKRCKEMGKITALDCAWDSKGKWGSLLNMSMPYIDIFIPSVDEAKMLSGESEPDKMADVFFANGVKKVIIKLGGDGCYARESKEASPIRFSAYKNLDVVDTTGAGDSFCSGFLAAMTKGFDFTESVEFANAVGAHCVMAKGATTGIKSFEEMKKFMEERR